MPRFYGFVERILKLLINRQETVFSSTWRAYRQAGLHFACGVYAERSRTWAR